LAPSIYFSCCWKYKF